MRSLLLVVALCVLSANAYVNPAGKYYFYSRLNPSNAYTLATGENNNNVGYFWGELESSSLTFHLLWTQKDVTRVSINGPVKCINNGNTFYTFNGGGGTDCNPSFNNNASIIWDLGPVQSYATKQISLSVEQILMLFNAEMDIVIATEPRPTGALRGQIRPFGRYFGSLQNSQILQLVRFEGNDGKYDPEAEVKSAGTASVGFGLIYHNTNQNPPRLDYRIMTNIETPGALSIRCPSLGSDTITKDTNNPVETSKTFTDKPELVLESLVSKKCYYYFRSAAYPEGELYAYPETLVPFQVDAYPGSMVPPVSSPNFATFIVDYDTATNVLDASLVTNITDPANSITSVDAYYTNENSDGVWACNLYTQAATNPQNPVGNRIYCRVNTTYEEPLLNKRFYFVLSTTTNPNGEMRGDLSSNGMAASSGGLSDTAKIAIGATVGAVVGVALIGGLIYLGVKKGAFSRSGKL